MATKKYTYISPDSFKATTRDTFRRLMGQYWYSTTDSLTGLPILSYGEPLGGEEGAPERYLLSDVDGGDGLSEPTVVTIDPQELFGASSFEDARYLTIKKVGNASSVGEYGIEPRPGRLAKALTISVVGADEHYQTLTKFSDDMKLLFSNPIVDGVEDFFYEESIDYEIIDDDVTATAEYNFFVEEYEQLSKTIQESVLPNFYAVSLSEYDVDPLGAVDVSLGLYDEVVNHALLYNNPVLFDALQENGVDPDMLDPSSTIDEYEYSIGIPYKEFLKEWSSAYTDLDFSQTSNLITQGKNIIQSYSSYDVGIAGARSATIQDLNERSLKMPFCIKLALLSEGKDIGTGIAAEPLADRIGGYDLSTSWVSHIISSLDRSLLVDPQFESEYEFISKQYRTYGGDTASLNASPILKRGPGYKSVSRIDQEVKSAESGALEEVNSEGSFAIDNKLIIDAKSQENIHAHELSIDFETHLTDADFSNSVGDYQLALHDDSDSWESFSLSTDGRLYNAIFQDGIASENQTLFYRVKKHRGDNTANVPAQDIWIPNAKDLMEYVDTQVRYGEQYTYDIYAYKYVFGTRYRYKELEPPTLDSVEIAVENEEQLVGYNFSWFGAKNLFDIHPSGIYIWQQAALDINSVGLEQVSHFDLGPDYDTFRVFSSYLDPVGYPLTGYPRDAGTGFALDWPAWTPKTTRFFSLTEIRNIMSQAWIVKPQTSVGGEEVSGLSWQEMWGQDWDDTWINEETPMTGGLSDEQLDAILRGVETDASASRPGVSTNTPDPTAYDPADFSLENWFHLFMGYDTGSPGPEPDRDDRPQKTPPSHHVLNGEHFGYPERGPEVGARLELSVGGALGGDGSWRLNRFVGLESEGGAALIRDGVLAAPALGAGATSLDDAFHGQNLGLDDVLAGAGVPLVEVRGYKAQYQVEMFPCTRIVEVPYATLVTSVLSKPPPPPEVEIIPYRAVNDELLFMFDATIAEMHMPAIPITQEDEELFERHYQAQGALSGEDLLFKSDDIPAFFEVFRLDMPPNSYSDFDGNKRATVSTLIDDEEKIIRSRSTDYIDKLQPNIKYYYTFRTVDFHGNVSNPTFIYEIELVDDGGAIYPLVRLYELPIINNKVASKTMKKMLQVYPALEQVTPNLPANTVGFDDPNDIALGEVALGNRDEAIWGKTFKIRLTSKKTGKKIDMNVTFDKKDERTTT